MKIKIQEGFLDDKYSKYAPDDLKIKGQPIVSFPFEILDVPEGTVSLCFSLIDYDAVPIAGFPWIHWLVANLPAEKTVIPEDFSRDHYPKAQGKNSLVSMFVGETDKQITEHYVGPTPPDKTHDYTLMVYAVSEEIPLGNGFYLNELLKSIEGKVLAEAKVIIPAKA